MATIREKQPAVWEVRVFTGADPRRPAHADVAHGARQQARSEARCRRARGRPGSGIARWAARSATCSTPGSSTTCDLAPSSGRDQQSRVCAVKQDPIARLPFARLSVGDVERWHTPTRKAGRRDTGIKNLHDVLRASLAQAQRWGWVSNNVAALARRRSLKTQRRSVMTVDDVRAVMTAAAQIDPAAVLAFRITAVTGARRAELAALQWTDVADGQLTIDSAIEIVERGDGSPVLRDAATKTADTRTLTLDPDTLALISSVGALRHPYGPWMFGLGLDLVRPDRIGWWWRRARKHAGIDVKWRLHDFRHWSATVAIGQGHDVRTVAGHLGHANPAMTLRVCAHAFAAADQAVAAGLGNILRDPEP